MTTTTPLFHIEYLVQGEPIRATRLALENNAKTIEAALAQKVTPPGIPDLNAEISARQTADAAHDSRLTALEAAGVVTNVTPAGTWVAFSAAYPGFQLVKRGKTVELSFMLKGGTAGASSTFGTIPVTHRPIGARYLGAFAQAGATSSVCPLVIDAAGVCTLSPPAGFTNVSGIFTWITNG